MKPVGFVFGLILICILRENKMDTDIDIELGAERWAKRVRWFRSRGLFETYQFLSGHPYASTFIATLVKDATPASRKRRPWQKDK